MFKKISFILIAMVSGLLSLRCGSSSPPNILLLPAFLALDTANSRLFVVDSANNGLSLIDTNNSSIVTGHPFLNLFSTLVIPQLPQDVAAFNLGNGVSRIFIIGNSPPPSNVMSILEYDPVNGLRSAATPTMSVGTNPNALLSGLQLDPASGNLFVSDHTDSQVRVYNATTLTEVTGSPLSVNPSPSKMGLNPDAESPFRLFAGGKFHLGDQYSESLRPTGLSGRGD
jgi:DNA-binding beta-propeller fold protein YncE